jgi:hypothetical protein
MIELLLPYVFDTLKYSWVKATIGIYTLADYFMLRNTNSDQVKVGDTMARLQPSGLHIPQRDNLKTL